MKKVIFLLSAILIASAQLYSQWVGQSTPTYYHYYSVFAIGSSTVYISGVKGIILKSTNSGNNWAILRESLDSYQSLRAIWFLNESTGICVGGRHTPSSPGIILRTTNGGNNWDSTGINETNFLTMYFVNASTGFAGGETGVNLQSHLYKTTNAGINWTLVPLNYKGQIKDIYFLNENTGWALADSMTYTATVVIKTTDGGNTWKYTGIPFPYIHTESISFVNENTGWATGRMVGTPPDCLKKTTDGGVTWFYQYPQYAPVDILGQYFINENTGWIVSSAGIQKTTNSGTNWYIQNEWMTTDITFIDQNTGWSVGNNAIVANTTNGGGTVSVQNISTEVPSAYSLKQNYPNPFNPVTKIRFDIKKSEVRSQNSEVTLKIFDITGKEVATLVNERLQPGTYETTFDGSALNSGVYFYKLISDGFTETKKMLMIK